MGGFASINPDLWYSIPVTIPVLPPCYDTRPYESPVKNKLLIAVYGETFTPVLKRKNFIKVTVRRGIKRQVQPYKLIYVTLRKAYTSTDYVKQKKVIKM